MRLPRCRLLVLASVLAFSVTAGVAAMGIGYAALVPTAARTGFKDRRRALAPLPAVGRLRQADLRPFARARDIPIIEFAPIEQRRTVGGDVASFPGLRLWGKNSALLAPADAVRRSGQASVPGLAVETGIQVVIGAVAEHDPAAASVLVTDSEDLAAAVRRELTRQVAATKHADRVSVALAGRQSAIVLVDDLEQASRVADG